MANIRRKYSIKQIQQLSIQDLSSLDSKDFRQVFTQVRDVIRKRVKVLEAAGYTNKHVYSPAYKKLMDGGGIISLKGKTDKRAQLEELKRGLDFVRAASGSRKGFEQYMQDIIDRFAKGGITFEEDEDDIVHLDNTAKYALIELAIEAYNKAKELAPAYMKYIRFKEVYQLVEDGYIVDADDFALWVQEWEDALLDGVMRLSDYRDSLEYNDLGDFY